jgi:hypothetical protein
MKKSATIIAAMVITSFTYAQKSQEKDVPAIVKTSFQKQFPDIKDADWEKEKENYEAEFEIKETEYSVLLDASGNVLETEIEISVDALPANVRDYVSKNYSGQKIKEAAKIAGVKGTLTYEAEIKGKDLLFDSNGNFIKEQNN